MDESQQDVLRTDVVVVQQACLFLRQHNHPPSSIGEPLEHSLTFRLEARSWTGCPTGPDIQPSVPVATDYPSGLLTASDRYGAEWAISTTVKPAVSSPHGRSAHTA